MHAFARKFASLFSRIVPQEQQTYVLGCTTDGTLYPTVPHAVPYKTCSFTYYTQKHAALPLRVCMYRCVGLCGCALWDLSFSRRFTTWTMTTSVQIHAQWLLLGSTIYFLSCKTVRHRRSNHATALGLFCSRHQVDVFKVTSLRCTYRNKFRQTVRVSLFMKPACARALLYKMRPLGS